MTNDRQPGPEPAKASRKQKHDQAISHGKMIKAEIRFIQLHEMFYWLVSEVDPQRDDEPCYDAAYQSLYCPEI
jgi:hypothetical protein